MSFSITVVKAEIDEFIRETVYPNIPVYLQSIADTTIMYRTDGQLDPYVAYQVGDIRYAGNETFGGVRSADFRLPIKAKIVVSGTEYAIGDEMRDRFYNRFYGASFNWAGEIRPMEGISGEFPLRKSDGSTEAIVLTMGVGIVTQFLEVPEP